MYFKSFKLNNFRKFRTIENVVEFADAESYEKQIKASTDGVNVASTVTLVVGKNNAGKTTIIEALKKLIKPGYKFGVNDFNFDYLSGIALEYQKGIFDRTPILEFEIVIGLDKGKDDYVTNIIPFLTIGGVTATQVSIYVKFELAEDERFFDSIKSAFKSAFEYKEKKDEFNFTYVLRDVIEEHISSYKLNYYNAKGKKIEKFSLNQLIDFVPILVQDVESGTALSSAFNRIVKYRYENIFSADKEKIEDDINDVNKKLTKNIEDKHTRCINAVLKEMISTDSIKINLSADITFKKLMDNLIKYQYVEDKKYVPESQFGLGYSNLMMIIAQLIEYIEKYPESSFNSKINLISIEEPETHMHPQMQELFIQYINDAVNRLLDGKNKHVNSQLLITTHSSHIVNSKIQSGSTFNNINYITEKKGHSVVVSLNDDAVSPKGDDSEKQFKFIKKHIKYGVSEVMFSDALILVEGMTEHAILPYYISLDPELNHRYISIVKIDGAHAYVYEHLLRSLGVPTAIITDLDIKRTSEERNKFVPITNLKDRKTTNKTIQNFYGDENIEGITCPIVCDNIQVFFQDCYDSQYRTSFEESFIAKNKDNDIINSILKELRPRVYKSVLGKKIEYDNNSKQAYRWQRSLSSLKSEFASSVLYKILVEEGERPELPQYIQDALKFIKDSLRREIEC